MTLRAAIAALRAVRERMTPGPWSTGVDVQVLDGDGLCVSCRVHRAANALGIAATHNATPALLDALDRIAAVVDRTDPSDGTNDYQALDEIRAILDGAVAP